MELTANLSARLKSETFDAHMETEKHLVNTLKGINSDRDYISLLKIFYGFFTPLEQLAASYINKADLPDIDQRRTSAFILDDLATLGYYGILPVSPFIPPVQDAADAFGVKYVLEGSTLGGPVIANMIRRNDRLHNSSRALKFFSGYGNDNMEMWRTFQFHLNSRFGTEPEMMSVSTSAKRTFSMIGQWIMANKGEL